MGAETGVHAYIKWEHAREYKERSRALYEQFVEIIMIVSKRAVHRSSERLCDGDDCFRFSENLYTHYPPVFSGVRSHGLKKVAGT